MQDSAHDMGGKVCLISGANSGIGKGAALGLARFSAFSVPLSKVIFKQVEEGAQTLLYLATLPESEGLTGKYFKNKMPVETAPQAQDHETAQRLWQVSAALTSL